MILSNITTPLLGLVDTAVIGHLAHAYYLGATAVGAMMITAITWLCGFLRMATTGLTAQAYGRNNKHQNLLILLRGLLVAITLGIIIIVFKENYIDISLTLAGGSEQIQFYARQYSEIRLWSLPAALANLVILGWLLGNHQAKTVMWLLIATNLINLSLDLLFVLGFQWQVSGVAYASLCADYSAFFTGLLLVFKQYSKTTTKLFDNTKHLLKEILNRNELSQYFSLNRDILIRTICLEICFIFITFQGARLGDNVVAANAILLNFLLFISFALDGIANAAEVLVGKAKGENNNKALHNSVTLALFWTAIFALFYSVIFWLFGEQLILLMTSIKSVVNYAQQYLLWIVFLPLLSCWCYLFDGVYIGLMQAKIMRNSMLFSTFMIFFPTWFLLQPLGNNALWAAFSLFMLSRGATLGWHYYHILRVTNKAQ
jgi:MATE family multidrug resistance protein